MTDVTIHRAALELLYQIDADLEKEGWDAPARLYRMEIVGCDPEGETAALQAEELPPPPRDLPPPVWLPMAALAVMESPSAPPEGFYGWVLMTEAWGATADTVGDPESAARITQAAREHRLDQLPEAERAEFRMLMLANLDGRIMISHERGGVVMEGSTYPEIHPAGTSVEHMEGRMWDGLQLLISATQAKRASLS